jgi:hypothetical protein
VNKLICDAIAAKLVITFVYEGKLRSAEPHLLGYSTRGILTLSAWQLSGGSAEAWRVYHCAKISNVTVTPQSFSAARTGYNPNGASFTSVICCI